MIILASASPRRQELLSLICDDFTVKPADIDESVSDGGSIENIPELLALKKAGHIFNNLKNARRGDIVIGCDTGVFIDGAMLGKPKDTADAHKMLRMLSGREHRVITGCAVLREGKTLSFSVTTRVQFYELSDSEIDEYISTGEPMDKAGAYGIQGRGALLVRGITGDFYNVVGLPVAALKRKLDEIAR